MMPNKKGFSLIELLVAMAISSAVMTAIFSMYRVQTRSHRDQQMVIQMQQNMRAAMFLLEREVRMAGYSIASPPVQAGFVVNFDSFGAPHDGSGATTDAGNIAFTVDNDDDGVLSDANGFEIIAYRRDAASNTLERWDAANGQWQVAAEQITALSFTFHREDDSEIVPPLTAAVMPDIRSVEVAIQATSEDRTMDLTNKIKCRNMGF